MSPGSQIRALTAKRAKPKMSTMAAGSRVDRKNDMTSGVMPSFCPACPSNLAGILGILGFAAAAATAWICRPPVPARDRGLVSPASGSGPD